jgi:hypothetical protein
MYRTEYTTIQRLQFAHFNSHIGAVVLLAMGIRDDPGHEEQAFWMFAKHPYGA